MNIQKKQSGFTIIEVVLVLAIAGLIFMMVFIALPALQRSQRDTQRKNDLSRAITAVTSFSSNNRNSLPDNDSTVWNKFAENYLRVNGDTFDDPSSTEYVFTVNAMADGKEFDSDEPFIYVNIGSTCDGESLNTDQGSRKVALQMKLEGGGVACQSN